MPSRVVDPSIYPGALARLKRIREETDADGRKEGRTDGRTEGCGRSIRPHCTGFILTGEGNDVAAAVVVGSIVIIHSAK